MFTYRLQSRVFVVPDGGPLIFPARARIHVELGPSEMFGKGTSHSRLLVRARKAQVLIDANTGRVRALSSPSLEPIEVIWEAGDFECHLDGDVLRYEFLCPSMEDLEGAVLGLYWVLPQLLAVKFPEPPYVRRVWGTIGESSFRWEHKPETWFVQYMPVTHEGMEQSVADALEQMQLFAGTANRRILAALSYFRTAQRLIVVGESHWEFMGEVILNYAKCMEALFVTSGNSRKDVRKGLAALGYSPEQIEGDYIPILLLRSQIDSAHASAVIWDSKDLETVHQYAAQSEYRMRDLLDRVLKSPDSTPAFKPEGAPDRKNSASDTGMRSLVEQMNARLEPLPPK